MTPTILQMEATECGAASLAMVLAHHGRWVPLEEMRVACGVSRDGSRASHLLRAARRYGLEAKGWRVEPEGIAAHRLPAIAFWEFNHFVVVERLERNGVRIIDPASGPRLVPHNEFDSAFTGVLLVFEPGPDFAPGGAKPRPLAAALSRLASAREGLAYLAIAAALALLPAVAVPAASKIFVDDVLVRGFEGWVRPLLLGLAFAALLRGGLTWLQEHAMARQELALGAGFGLRFFRHMLRLPTGFFAQRYAGDLASRASAASETGHRVGAEATALLAAALAVLFHLGLMLLYDPVLTIVGVMVALLNALVVQGVATTQREATRQVAREGARMAAVSVGGIQAIETLKAGGLEADFFGRWAGLQARLLNARLRLQLPALALDLLPTLLAGLGMAAVLGLGALRAMDGAITIGTLVAFQALLSGFFGPVQALTGATARLRALQGEVERVEDVAAAQPDPRLLPGTTPSGPAARLSGQVEMRGLAFGYSPLEAPLIQDFSLHLEPGARIALVGASGSGKSTIARLLAGLYDHWAGEILLDGRPAASTSRDAVAASLGFVDQQVALFRGTVRENLTLWDDTIPEADILAAARDACLHEVILARPGGYDGTVAEGGTDLSGGQAQRLEIARALVHRPSLLILDEATSALDPVVEARLLANLRRRGCTTLVVAHRLSTIRDCDEILVMERGQVVQRGDHATLIAQPGPYAELVRGA
ncbi:NHLP family bacteriocin export ABC transporter peptidase/permease/ATPase subunit [Sabulicella rubraurantiaca]|uniref:NHLP family bacteriocin export ABC transporter peptidase/permease/ATPase subunit n=1 Tax=Sabulicella rubraurantiaca TaxID=2811429 RepID=UPI002E2C41FA|nr:NHLP family bacteriocin export ABC transporter peptidase/permease/ATPase subunit [Sabulicella rubraurantiaca]